MATVNLAGRLEAEHDKVSSCIDRAPRAQIWLDVALANRGRRSRSVVVIE